MHFPFHATTFLRFFLRFLYNLRSLLCISSVQTYAHSAVDEYPSCVSVIASFPSTSAKKIFCIFLTKPLDRFSFLLYIVDTKKKGMIPMK